MKEAKRDAFLKELKKVIRPLVKEALTEYLQDETNRKVFLSEVLAAPGTLGTLIKEVQGIHPSPPIQPQRTIERKKLPPILEQIDLPSNIDSFPRGGDQTFKEEKEYSAYMPLKNRNPNDPGISLEMLSNIIGKQQ